jgi:hypothetical protein
MPTEIKKSTTIDLDTDSRLYSYSLSSAVALTIPSHKQEIHIYFTPAQLDVLEEVIAKVRLLEKQQRAEQKAKLSCELKRLSEPQELTVETTVQNGNGMVEATKEIHPSEIKLADF